jgi:hypothetical protein
MNSLPIQTLNLPAKGTLFKPDSDVLLELRILNWKIAIARTPIVDYLKK